MWKGELVVHQLLGWGWGVWTGWWGAMPRGRGGDQAASLHSLTTEHC